MKHVGDLAECPITKQQCRVLSVEYIGSWRMLHIERLSDKARYGIRDTTIPIRACLGESGKASP